MALQPFMRKNEGLCVQYDGTNETEIRDIMESRYGDDYWVGTTDGVMEFYQEFAAWGPIYFSPSDWLVTDGNFGTGPIPDAQFSIQFKLGDYTAE